MARPAPDDRMEDIGTDGSVEEEEETTTDDRRTDITEGPSSSIGDDMDDDVDTAGGARRPGGIDEQDDGGTSGGGGGTGRSRPPGGIGGPNEEPDDADDGSGGTGRSRPPEPEPDPEPEPEPDDGTGERSRPPGPIGGPEEEPADEPDDAGMGGPAESRPPEPVPSDDEPAPPEQGEESRPPMPEATLDEPERRQMPDVEQGVELGEAVDQNIQSQAEAFEQELVSQREGFEPEDIRITQTGDTLEAELTRTGERVATAQELGLEEEDIAFTEFGGLTGATDTGEAQLNIERIRAGLDEQFPEAEGFSIQQEEPGVFDVEVETPEGTEEFFAGPEAESFVDEQQVQPQPDRGVSGRNVPAPDIDRETEPTGREIDFGPAEDLVNRFEEATGIDVPETQEQRFETEQPLPGEEIARDIGEGALETGREAGEFLFAEDTGVASKSGTAAILREAGFEDAAAQTEQTIRNVGLGITTGVGALGQKATTLPFEVGEVTATAADEGVGETGAQLGQSAAEAAASGVAGAAKNPALTAGSAIGSAALSGGLFRATQGRPIAGRTSRVALQPIEEAAKFGASRGAIPTRAATAVPGVRRGQMGLETETEVENGTIGRIQQFRQEVERFAAAERGQAQLIGRTETEVESETRQVELEETESISDIEQEQALEQERAQRELEQELNRIRRGEEERIEPTGTQEEFTAPERGGGGRVTRGAGGRTARAPGQVGAGPRGPQQSAFRTGLETETETEAETRLEEAQAAEAQIGEQLDFALDTRPGVRAGALGAITGADAMARTEAAQASELATSADADVFGAADMRTLPASETALDIETELETELELETEREFETETETESEAEFEFERELETEQELEREFEIETETEMEREQELDARFRPEDETGMDEPMGMPGDVATEVFQNIDQDLQDLAEDY